MWELAPRLPLIPTPFNREHVMTRSTRREFLKTSAAAGLLAASPRGVLPKLALPSAKTSPPAKKPPAKEFQVACYYFPDYHLGDPRLEELKGKGWTEWELVKAAKPRFAGHQQPKVPAWGYTDESDPKEMAQKIDAAADHGIDAFIFDWYYYDDGPVPRARAWRRASCRRPTTRA